MNDLALLPSERRQLQDKIREVEQRFSLAYSQACSKFTRIINESNLTVEEKQDILSQLWK
jgi:predicted transcriptional regulator